MSLGIPRSSYAPSDRRSSSPEADSDADHDGFAGYCCPKCPPSSCPKDYEPLTSGSGSGYGSFSSDPVRYANGEVKFIGNDLASDGFGVPWGHTRSYSNQLTNQADGTNGNSWRVAEWPYLVEASATSVCVVAGTIYDAVWFDLVQSNYVPRFSVPATLVHDVAKQQYLYTDGRGYTTTFFDYSGGIAAALQGQFKSFTDLSGVETFPSYDPQTNLITSFVRQAQNASSGFYYVYYASGDNAGMLQSVTLQVNGQAVKRVNYLYYGAKEPYGNLNDLKLVTIQQNTPQGWADVQLTYYRYYQPGEPFGFTHGLKYQMGQQNYNRMLEAGIYPETATNAQVAKYADNAFQYNLATQAATQEKTMGGRRKFSLILTNSAFPSGFNNWAVKAVETLPDGNQNLVYTNYAGQVILSILQAGQEQWFNCNQYDNGGLITQVVHSSAVQGYDESQPGLVTLQPNSGLIDRYVYYPSTNIAAGAVAGYMQYKQVQQGGAGQPILVKEYQYSALTALNTTLYVMAKEVCYPDANDPLLQLQCKIYSYTWQGTTLQIDQKTTTFPLVPTSQNGSGEADRKIEAFDTYGNLTWAMDERGFLTNNTYDIATGAVTQWIQDVDTSITGGAPAGWQTPPGGGLNLVTNYTVDSLGRVTQALGPLHDVDVGGINTTLRRATWTVYQDAIFQVWEGSGYAVPTASGYASTLINPVALSFQDLSVRDTDNIQAVRADTTGPLTANDSFPQSSWVSWTNRSYAWNHNLAYERVYFAVPQAGPGLAGINYNETKYRYDKMERQIRVKTPGGTITRTVYNPMGWTIGTWVGTNDNGATDSDPSGNGQPYQMGNNMVQTQANQYDGGLAGGDGNLTEQTNYVDAATQRVTTYGYDFRDRQTVVDGEIDFYQVNTYDNLDRVIQVDRYNTTAQGNLIARTATNYDSRGRIFQSVKYGINPVTGQVGPGLTDNTWFDPSNNIVQLNKAGSDLLQKTAINGVNWKTAQYSCLGDSSVYPYPVDVSQDTVLQQQETTYDDASNSVLQAIRERFNNATGLGALTSPTGPQPQARVNFVATWPDPLGRPQGVGNYGTNQGVALVRPDTAPDSSATVLVTTTAYNNAGRPYQVTDPMGTVRQSGFDDAGRLTQLLENYVPGGTGSDQNRETDYTYNPNGKIATLTAKNSVTGDQVTQYVYGTMLGNSDVASNELLRTTIYPDDSPTTPDRVVMAYNAQGQVKRKQDQLGTVHALAYDLLGRLTSDSITTLGAGVDGTVRQIGRTYEVRGMLQNLTSYGSATGGTVVNDVLMQYDQFANLSGQYQSHAGAASPSSPAVQYGYADGSANTVRLTGVTYPSGRELNVDYGPAGQANDLLSRVNALVDDDGVTQMAAYAYVGLNRIAQVNSPQPGTLLTYIQQGPNNPPPGTGGDQYTGWDQFDRIVDQRWLNAAGTDLERCQFGYNLASNRLWRKNVVAVQGQDEFYTYDGLSQLAEFQRGTLNGSNTGLIGTPAWAEDFTFDPTGNWQNYVNQVNGQETLNQPRTHNSVNEILTIGGSGSLINQDAAGNIVKAPQPANWSKAYTLTYDAWNRLVQVKNGSKLVATYAYDGQNWRITKTAGGTARDYYYNSQWQIVEEQVTAGTPDRQYVWGLLGLDNLVLRDPPALSERFYAFSDTVSVAAIADANGNVQERYGYNAYGAPLFMSASFAPLASSQFDWRTLYDSYHYDGESGFYQVRNRYLHPGLGRWLTRDPIGYEGGINLYAYCKNNSVDNTDPSGLDMSHKYDCDYRCEIIDPITGHEDIYKGTFEGWADVCSKKKVDVCCKTADQFFCNLMGNGNFNALEAFISAEWSFEMCLLAEPPKNN